jgi:type I restriction enzyme R subunit
LAVAVLGPALLEYPGWTGRAPREKVPPTGNSEEPEWRTRRERIDPRLDTLGWTKPPPGTTPLRGPHRTEEEETDNGPADYALWLDRQVVGLVEAKKLTLGPQNVLTQAERYGRGLRNATHNFDGCRCPFLYSTNGEVTWFRDARHPLNRSRPVSGFHTPNALHELLTRDFDAACESVLNLPHDHPRLRQYQKDANAAVEKAIAERHRNILVAMATGTGKTFTMVSQIYRLMKSGASRRVLFLVDRRALAAQAVRAFASFEAEPGQKFDQIYEVYSSRFQTGDFGDEEKFDPKVLPQRYLTDPQPGHAFVYVATIQRVAMNVLGRNAIFGFGDETIEDDATKLDIPIHAFDLVVADECHRGYTSQELSTWRGTLDHFDAIKIGLTATPASHTTAYFTHKAFSYSYAEAVSDGYLVDYDVVRIRSQIRMEGVFLREGEGVEVVDPTTGLSRMDTLEDEREFDTGAIERAVTAPDSNRKIIEELKRYTDAHELEHGRFPKTLLFAANDLPHTSHSDQLVSLAREIYGRGDAFVGKITGRVDRPLQRIREFRNRPMPGIAITVDLLTTGVDIPDLEFVVLLRPVRSRILFEQMLGRGTRLGERFTKTSFTVVDCFDGTLLAYFKNATGITAEDPIKPSRTIAEVIEDIWDNRDRDYNIAALAKRLQRIDRSMSGEGRAAFAAYIPDGDLARFARGLATALRDDFTGVMSILQDEDFQTLLVNYPRPERTFVRAIGAIDEVGSVPVFRDVAGNEYKPEDYLTVFSHFIRDNPAHIDAVRVLLDRPRDWSASALIELRDKLRGSRYGFTTDKLQKAHEIQYRKPLVDVISMVKHAVHDHEPLWNAAERVERAFAAVTAGQTFTPDQQAWLDRIRQVMLQNLSIDREDFDYQDALASPGGWGAARRVFGEQHLVALVARLNEAIAA